MVGGCQLVSQDSPDLPFLLPVLTGSHGCQRQPKFSRHRQPVLAGRTRANRVLRQQWRTGWRLPGAGL